MVDRKDLIFEKNKYIYNFQQFKTIGSFPKNAYCSEINLSYADKDQSNLLIETAEFNKNPINNKYLN